MKPHLFLQKWGSDVPLYLKELKMPAESLKQSNSLNLVVISLNNSELGEHLNCFLFNS